MILLAVDPGKVTGLLVWQDGEVVMHEQLPSYDFLLWAEGVIPLYAPPLFRFQIATERFQITAQTVKKQADAHWAIGVNTTLEFWCQKYSVHLEQQTPATAKSFATNAKLRALGWYKPTKGGHANDAARHALVRLVNLGLIRVADIAGSVYSEADDTTTEDG